MCPVSFTSIGTIFTVLFYVRFKGSEWNYILVKYILNINFAFFIMKLVFITVYVCYILSPICVFLSLNCWQQFIMLRKLLLIHILSHYFLLSCSSICIYSVIQLLRHGQISTTRCTLSLTYTTFYMWPVESYRQRKMFVKRWQNMYNLLLAL
jgi:hypothetical protein